VTPREDFKGNKEQGTRNKEPKTGESASEGEPALSEAKRRRGSGGVTPPKERLRR